MDIRGNGNAGAGDNSTLNISNTINYGYREAAPASVDAGQLAQARELLASLPDTPPEPQTLASSSRMASLQTNRLFVGRGPELQAVAAALKAGKAAVIGQSPVITGWGGVGKTQLATEVAYRYGRYFAGGVFWLSFAEPAGIASEIAACGQFLGLHEDFPNLPLGAQVSLVSSRWQDGLPRLLVFDNCEDPDLLKQWAPPGGDCRVILTSRRANWPLHLGLVPVPLDTLPRDESIALLRKHLPDLAADATLDAIAHELGDLPLALHMAASYLARYRHTDAGRPETYLEAIRKPGLLKHRSLTQDDDSSPTGHEQHVAKTFALSHDRLDPNKPVGALARKALTHAACFAPGEPIPRWLLARVLALDCEDEDNQCDLADALDRLAELGLIDNGAAGPLLHRLVSAFACDVDRKAENTRAEVEKIAIIIVGEQNDHGLPSPLSAWQFHLWEIAETAADRGSDQASQLLNELGYYLQSVADFEGAKVALLRNLSIEEEAFGRDHANVAITVNNLGSVLRDLGDLNGAKVAFQRALDIGAKTLPPDDPKIALRLNNLGSALRGLGDLDAARANLQSALEISQKAFGQCHENVVAILSNLGGILKSLGYLEEAKIKYEMALEIGKGVYHQNHPSFSTLINNMGTILLELGDLHGAEAAFQKALNIAKNAYEANHPIIASDINNLGAVQEAAGHLRAAAAHYQCALTILESRFAWDHPQVQAVRENLARVSKTEQ